MFERAGHDVSDEPRDPHGEWTSGGGPAPKLPSAGVDVPQYEGQRETEPHPDDGKKIYDNRPDPEWLTKSPKMKGVTELTSGLNRRTGRKDAYYERHWGRRDAKGDLIIVSAMRSGKISSPEWFKLDKDPYEETYKLKNPRLKFDPNEPRDEHGRWTSGGSEDTEVTFVSPNVSNLTFAQAASKLNSAEQRKLAQVSNYIDGKLGITDSTNRQAIGAWSDGAENSLMVVAHGASQEQMRAAAAMKGHLADQKAVLVFTPKAGGTHSLMTFDVKDDSLEKVHNNLLQDGLAFHTLEDLGGGNYRVHAMASDQAARDAAEHAAERYNASGTSITGTGEFIGSSLESGTDRDQRDDARSVYEQTLENVSVPGRDVGRVWNDVRDYWRSIQAEGKGLGAVLRQPGHDVSDEPRDPGGKWTSGGGGTEGGGDKDKPGREHPGKGYSKDAYVDSKGVIHTSNVYDAQRALFEDRKVELKQVKQVSTLIKRLGETAAEMAEQGEQAPVFNLCNVSVEGTNLFCSQQKGIPRAQMPVIPAKRTKEFIKYLKSQGYKVEKDTEKAENLRATQSEIDGAKVATQMQRIKKEGFYKRLVISRDDYILDGHHTWAGEVGLDAQDNKLSNDKRVKTARVDIPIMKLIEVADKWTKEHGIAKKPAGQKGFVQMTMREAAQVLDPRTLSRYYKAATDFFDLNPHLPKRDIGEFLIVVRWDESQHPRGETTPGTTPGSFAPAGGGEGAAESAASNYGYKPEDAKKFKELRNEWAKLNNALLRHISDPGGAESLALVAKQESIVKEIHTLKADPGGPTGIGLPGGPRDVTIVGAGPGGLMAAINGGAEGLDTLLIDAETVPGGQAKYSSRIENFGGFLVGVKGEKLAGDMFGQAKRVGAEAKLGIKVIGMTYDEKTGLKTLTLSNGEKIESRTVILSGGLVFRRLTGIPGIEGPGVVTGNPEKIATIAKGGDVCVIGGSNGGAQAALGCVEEGAKHVYLMSRSPIEEAMSDYVVAGVRNEPRITVIEGEQIAKLNRDAQGNIQSMETAPVDPKAAGKGHTLPISSLGVFIGSVPDTKWIDVNKAKGGRIITSPTLETTMPGVFAAGDIREGTVAAQSNGRVGMAAGDGQFALKQAQALLIKQQEAAAIGVDKKAYDSADRATTINLITRIFDMDRDDPWFGQTIDGVPPLEPPKKSQKKTFEAKARWETEVELWPEEGEKRSEFMDRCVGELTPCIGGDKAEDVCTSKWEQSLTAGKKGFVTVKLTGDLAIEPCGKSCLACEGADAPFEVRQPGHDVSDEPRDPSGKWTSDGPGAGAAGADDHGAPGKEPGEADDGKHFVSLAERGVISHELAAELERRAANVDKNGEPLGYGEKWTPYFQRKLAANLEDLPQSMRDWAGKPDSSGYVPLRINYRSTLDDVPPGLRSAFETAAAITVNHSRIEFFKDRFPTPATLRHEMTHLAWYDLTRGRYDSFGRPMETDRSPAGKVIDEAVNDTKKVGDELVKFARRVGSKTKPPPAPEGVDADTWFRAWQSARSIRKDLNFLRKYARKGALTQSMLKGSLELHLMVPSEDTVWLAKYLGHDIPSAQLGTIAEYHGMANALKTPLTGEYAEEEPVAYRAGVDKDYAQRLFAHAKPL